MRYGATWAVLLAANLAWGQVTVNLIKNPGLEEDVPTGMEPPGWAFFQSPDGKYTSQAATPGHDSERAWAIEGKGEYGGVLAGRTTVAPDRAYVGGGWAKVIGPGQAAIKLDYYAGEELVGSVMAGLVLAHDGWQQFRLIDTRVAFPTATKVGLVCVLVGEGVALFDDLYLASLPRPTDQPDNLLANGDFELGVGERPAMVTLHGYPNETPWWRWTPEAAHSGERGLKIKGDTTYVILAHDPIEIKPGFDYTLTGWIRARAGEAVLKFDFMGDKYKWLGQETSKPAAPNGEWQQLTMRAYLEDYPDTKYIGVAAFATEPGTDADFDEFILTAKPKAP